MSWTPQTNNEKPTVNIPGPESNLSKKEPGMPEADKQTKMYYDKTKTSAGQSQPPWQAKDTGAKGQLNNVPE